MKRKDLVNLYNVITQINLIQKDNKFSIKFTYAILKLAQQIDKEITILINIQQQNDNIKKEYVNEMNKLCNDNKCKFDNGNWILPDDKAIVNIIKEKTLELQKKYEYDLKEFEKANFEFQKILEEDISIAPLYKITDITIIPDCITFEQLNIFMQCGIVD